MARIMAIDYGEKRTGIATTDPMQLIASPLETVSTLKLMDFFERYFKTEEAECLVVGLPLMADGNPASIEPKIQDFIKTFSKKYPAIEIQRHDERYTSKRASEVILKTVKSKKKRQDKGLVDRISAAIILQEYMGFL